MTPEQQQIAIAEACGKHQWRGDEQERDCFLCGGKPPAEVHHIPNYPSDLNAMHEAEKVLNEPQAHQYQMLLEGSRKFVGAAEFWTYHATAAQRAEAFLRTIGKWIE